MGPHLAGGDRAGLNRPGGHWQGSVPNCSVRQTPPERGRGPATLLGINQRRPFRHFNTSPEVIRLAVMLYVRFPLLLRNVENLLHARGIEVSHEMVRFLWRELGPTFAAEVNKGRHPE